MANPQIGQIGKRFQAGAPSANKSGKSRLDARYWMQKYESIEDTLSNSQKLSFIRPITIALIDSIKNSPAIDAQRKYNEKKAKQTLDRIIAQRRQSRTSVTTSVNAAASSENPALPREDPPKQGDIKA